MGILRVNVNGVWEDVLVGGGVGGGGTGAEEVAVGPDDPGAGIELWYDTDAIPAEGGAALPEGGLPEQVLAMGDGTRAGEVYKWVDMPLATEEALDERSVMIDQADPTGFTNLLLGHADLVARLAAIEAGAGGEVYWTELSAGTIEYLGKIRVQSVDVMNTSAVRIARLFSSGNNVGLYSGTGAAVAVVDHTTSHVTIGNPTGTLSSAAPAPSAPTHIATKQYVDDSVAAGGGGGGMTVDVQVFSTPGAFTWTKPAGAVLVHVSAVGSGGGGGSGRKGAFSTVRTGGSGGGSGTYAEAWLDATTLPATLSGSVGAGGAGGAEVTTNDTNGNNGTNGQSTGLWGATNYIYTGVAGRGNLGWTATANGGTTGTGGLFPGTTGGASGNTGSFGAPGVNALAGSQTTGGGAGGGITAANVASAGGAGGTITMRQASGVGGFVGTSPTQDGKSDNRPPGTLFGASGGGGGAASTTGDSGPGGAGVAGSGGGGGGAALNDVGNAGAGGKGGDGLVVIKTWMVS